MRHIATEHLYSYASKLFIFTFACLMSFSAFAGNKSEMSDAELKKIKNEAKDFVEAVDNYSVKQKRQTMRKIDQAVLKLDNNIESLEQRIDKRSSEMTEESREELSQALKEIREQRIEMAEWYGSLKTSTDTAWDEMKTGFTEAYEELHEAWLESEEAFSS